MVTGGACRYCPSMDDWYLIVASSAAALAVMLTVALLSLIS
jgi:hypothetical protein